MERIRQGESAEESKETELVELGEAWLLGDLPAVRKAYPHAKEGVLASYINDDICGTWEKLADAIVSGGAKSLDKQG